MPMQQRLFSSLGTWAKALAVGAILAGPAAASSPAAPESPLYQGRFDAFAGKSLDQTVAILVAREEIRDLIAIYAHRVARGMSIADLYTDDGAYIHHHPGAPDKAVRGRKALDDYFRSRPADAEHPLPMIHNYLIAVNGDEATGICSNELRIVENGQSIVASGYYRDRYRREDGFWRFVTREVTFFHWAPIQQGWARPRQGW